MSTSRPDTPAIVYNPETGKFEEAATSDEIEMKRRADKKEKKKKVTKKKT